MFEPLGLTAPRARPAAPATAAGAPAAVANDPAQAAFDAALDAFTADSMAAQDLILTAGVPPAEAKAFWAAYRSMEDAMAAEQWAKGLTLIALARKAAQAVLLIRQAGKAYYDAYATAGADIERGRAAYFDADAVADALLLQKKRFDDADTLRIDAVAKKKWADARKIVLVQQATAIALDAALAKFKLGKVPFDAELRKLRNADKAREAAAKAPTGIQSVEGRSFRDRWVAFNDAREAADFGAATAALAPLQLAIDALLAAIAAAESAKGAYETALAAVKGREAASRLAATAPPPLAGAAAAWTAADTAVTAAAGAERWVEAKAAVGVLAAATAALEKAGSAFNAATMPADFDAFRKKLAALKPRLDKAGENAMPAYVEALQKAVRIRSALIDASLAAKDLAAAEADLTAVVQDLGAMERAKVLHAAYEARYVVARDGAVAKARALALQPQALATTRDQSLDASDKEIAVLASAGNLAAADARIARWLREAKAWTAARAAYDSLMATVPNEAKLKALASVPGGDDVMDALVASLPPETSQRVLSAALKARFGLRIKSFEKKNAKDVKILTGLKKVDPTLPDKSLQRIYAVLGNVPIDMKGKVTDIIEFEQNAHGAMYDNKKKIYMYTGRPDDATTKEQAFGVEGMIVPSGEDVDERCQPVNANPVKFFDFALLHEAGHAEDDAGGFMDTHLDDPAYGGWRIDDTPAAAAKAAAAHFKYPDEAHILATLTAAAGKPPPANKPMPKAADKAEWEAARSAALDWCRLVRVDSKVWNDASQSKKLAIGGRVYQEGYKNYWVSYVYAARAQGISGYQFRSQMEWFAELYAAFFSDKLKDTHPAAPWLAKFKTPA